MYVQCTSVLRVLLVSSTRKGLKNSVQRRALFESSDCTDILKFEVESLVPGKDLTAELNSKDQRIFYFSNATTISMECYAKFPIEIQLERETPILVKDLRIERSFADFFDNATYCYKIRYSLSEEDPIRITGKYTCKGITRQNDSSSIFIFMNSGNGRPQFLNKLRKITISGKPDDAGVITIPCISTNPLQKPELYRVIRRPDSSDSSPYTFAKYNPTRGFVISANQGDCCSQKYYCSLLQELTVTVNLQTFGKRTFVRTPNPKHGDKSNIKVLGPQQIHLYCESNEAVRLNYSLKYSISEEFLNATTMVEDNPHSFYKHRISFSGYLAHDDGDEDEYYGDLKIYCNSQATGTTLYTWKYTVLYNGNPQEPGLKFSDDVENLLTCEPVLLTEELEINIYNIQCENYINCQTADRFSGLAIPKRIRGTDYPFIVDIGNPCPSGNQCVQIHHRVEWKQGIIQCIDSTLEKRVYTLNYIKGLNGQIIPDYFNTKNEDGVLQMLSITRKIYYNETVTFQCEALSAVFAQGIQLVFTLKDGSFLTKNNLTFDNYEEKNQNGRITLRASLLILEPNFQTVACNAPFWKTEDWKIVSQPLTVEKGKVPLIAESEIQFTWLLSDVNKSIKCEASGDPAPSLTWTRDNDRVRSSKNKQVFEDKKSQTTWILFERVEESHSGKYLCKAENILGVAQKLFKVKIKFDGITRDLIIYGSIFGIVIIFLCVLVVVLVKRILNTRSALPTAEIKLFKLGNPDLQGKEGADVFGRIEHMPYDQIYEIHRSRFTWQPTAILGKGAFGIVYKGKYLDRPIAIKTIQPPSVSRSTEVCVYTRALLSEIKVMCYLASPGINEHSGKMNIVSLIGANTKNIRKDVYLLCEFCELGSLEGYLYKQRQKFQPILLYSNRPADASVSVRSSHSEAFISTADLTKWAYEIANGMAYVSSRNIIHGDLAARNVLLSSARVAKISDFGLSRRLYEYNTYTKQNKEPLPWRWMAIESLKHMKFSSQSDVWSYGITVWEIFSLAEVPYPGLTWTVDFVDTLEQGMRPTRPKHASENIYKLMKQTWLENPDERQNFEQIRTEMRSIYEEYISQNYESLTPSNFA